MELQTVDVPASVIEDLLDLELVERGLQHCLVKILGEFTDLLFLLVVVSNPDSLTIECTLWELVNSSAAAKLVAEYPLLAP